jgi:hypothetical protein
MGEIGIEKHRDESEERHVGNRVSHLALLRLDDRPDRKRRRDAADRRGGGGERAEPIRDAEEAGEPVADEERDDDDRSDDRPLPTPRA